MVEMFLDTIMRGPEVSQFQGGRQLGGYGMEIDPLSSTEKRGRPRQLGGYKIEGIPPPRQPWRSVCGARGPACQQPAALYVSNSRMADDE